MDGIITFFEDKMQWLINQITNLINMVVTDVQSVLPEIAVFGAGLLVIYLIYVILIDDGFY